MSAADLRAELEALHVDYAAALDGGDLPGWAALFTEDGLYRVTTAENVERGWPLSLILCEGRAAIEDRQTAVESLMMTAPRRMRRILGPSRVAWDGADACTAETPFVVFETLAGQLPAVFATGVYRDRIVRREGRLVFEEKVCVCDGELVRNSLIQPI